MFQPSLQLNLSLPHCFHVIGVITLIAAPLFLLTENSKRAGDPKELTNAAPTKPVDA